MNEILMAQPILLKLLNKFKIFNHYKTSFTGCF